MRNNSLDVQAVVWDRRGVMPCKAIDCEFSMKAVASGAAEKTAKTTPHLAADPWRPPQGALALTARKNPPQISPKQANALEDPHC